MWMTGLVGMATKYAEAAGEDRIIDPRGEMNGGPQHYLTRVGGTGGSWACSRCLRRLPHSASAIWFSPPGRGCCASFRIDPQDRRGNRRTHGRGDNRRNPLNRPICGLFVPLMIALYMAGSLVAHHQLARHSRYIYVCHPRRIQSRGPGGRLCRCVSDARDPYGDGARRLLK